MTAIKKSILLKKKILWRYGSTPNLAMTIYNIFMRLHITFLIINK
jgi:hypothetical protein